MDWPRILLLDSIFLIHKIVRLSLHSLLTLASILWLLTLSGPSLTEILSKQKKTISHFSGLCFLHPSQHFILPNLVNDHKSERSQKVVSHQDKSKAGQQSGKHPEFGSQEAWFWILPLTRSYITMLQALIFLTYNLGIIIFILSPSWGSCEESALLTLNCYKMSY